MEVCIVGDFSPNLIEKYDLETVPVKGDVIVFDGNDTPYDVVGRLFDLKENTVSLLVRKKEKTR